MRAPQIIWLTINLLGLGISLAKHGEPKEGKYSFWWTLLSLLINVALLYWGSFFG